MKDIAVICTVSKNHLHYVDRWLDSLNWDIVQPYIVHDMPRRGKGYRLNQIIPTIKEKWLAVIDADDWCTFARFEMLIPKLNNADMYFTDTREYGLTYQKDICPEWDYIRYKRECHIASSSWIFKTEFVQKFPHRMSTYGQDWLWISEMAQHSTPVHIHGCFVCYRNYSGFTNNGLYKLKYIGAIYRRIRRMIVKNRIKKL